MMAWLKCTRSRNVTQVTLLYFSQHCTTNWWGRLFFWPFQRSSENESDMETLSHRCSHLCPSPSLLRFFFLFVCLFFCFVFYFLFFFFSFSLYYLNVWDRLHQLLIQGSLRIDDFRTTPPWVTSQFCVAVLQKFEFTIFSKDDNVGAHGRQIFPPFLKFVFFFSQESLFVQPKCLT